MGKGRTPCCDKARVKKGPWSQAEDLKLLAFVQRYGHTNWRSLPKLAGLARCGKSCRLRWVNYLRPDVKRGGFTPQEEETIIRLQSLLGNKWSKIASHLPGRTDNEIKNVWNTHLKKRTTTTKINDSMSPTSSNCTTDENINEVLEIPDEPNMVQLWDSLMLDDRHQPSISDCTTFATFQGNTQSNHHTNNNSLGWQFGMPENFEHEIMTTIGNDQEKNTCAQLQEEALKMESYLEILSWPSSPNYDTYLGF